MFSEAKLPSKIEFDERLTNLFRLKGFSVGRLISRGAFGSVFRGTNLKTNLPVAIKVMFLDMLTQRMKEKFLPSEIEVLKQVSQAGHPHIVFILDILQARKKLFIFMELGTGDIGGYLNANKALSEPQSALWFGQVGSALHFLHVNQRMAHRDIKLENCLLFGEVAKLADFGYATRTWDVEHAKPLLSQTWCGTPPYYCPQILKFQPYSASAADCYSMGVMLFVMLNNKFPFHYYASKLHFHEQTDPGFLRTRYIKQFSADLIDLQMGLLAVDENIRLNIEEVMAHSWIKRSGK